jgi:hypothetical protein
MSNGFYKCTDPDTETKDWLSLNFNSIPGQIFSFMAQKLECYELLERVNPATMPCDTCDGEGEVVDDEHNEHYSPDTMECEDCDATGQVLDNEYELHGWPAAWNCMWQAADHEDLRASLDAAGFVVYNVGPKAEDMGFEGLIFGVDAAGYEFYTSHWIPLRAELCLRVDRMLHDETRLRAILRTLEKECEGVAGEVESFRRRFGKHYLNEQRVTVQK